MIGGGGAQPRKSGTREKERKGEKIRDKSICSALNCWKLGKRGEKKGKVGIRVCAVH
jgi:hypothetical protein